MNLQQPTMSNEQGWADAVCTLSNSLRLALHDDIAYQDQETLAFSWKGIVDTLAMLRRVSTAYLQRHAELCNHLAVFHRIQTHTGFVVDETQQSQPLSVTDVERVYEVWYGFDQLNMRYRSYMFSISRGLPNTEEGVTIVLDLVKAIAWISRAIELLRESYTRIHRARGALTPVLCLNENILHLVFGLLAEYEAPTKTSLGWMRLSHVCSTWRLALLNMSDVWARDAFTFGSDVATRYILPRARKGLVSVSQARLPLIKLPLDSTRSVVPFQRQQDYEVLEVLAREGTIRDLNISCTRDALCALLGRVLGNRTIPHLRALNLLALWKAAEPQALGLNIPLASHPNLEHVEFVNTFIPFSLPHLVSLHVLSTGKEFNLHPSYFEALLDSLECSPTLKDLRMYPWSSQEPPANPRTIALPNLETLVTNDIRLSDLLHVPKLSALDIVVLEKSTTRVRAALNTVFMHHRLPLRSMQLSQRVKASPGQDILVMQFGWTSSNCPPPAVLPFQANTVKEPVITIILLLEKHRSTRALSGVFRSACDRVHETQGTEGIEVLGFDNETREHTFFGSSPPTPFYPMLIPTFLSVRKVELPLRDSDSTYHLLYSLGTDANITHLPLLNCLMFRGFLENAYFRLEVRLIKVLRHLIRARATSNAVASITSLELELDSAVSSSSAPRHGTEHDLIKLEQLKQAVNAVVAGIQEIQATVTFREEYMVIPKTNRFGVRVLATIVYKLPTSDS